MMDEAYDPHRHRHAHEAPEHEHGHHGGHAAHHGIDLDGQVVVVHDGTPTGRQIREAGGLSPASAFVLILAADGGTRSIGLDVPVDLAEVDGGLFRSFESDVVHEFTVDERGFEWGTHTIPARDVRLYGRIHLNALNATFAVIRWKQWCGFYKDLRQNFYIGFSVATGEVVSEGLR